MIASISRARVSFSKSGGLKQFMHIKVPSAATSLRDTDFSLMEDKKYERIEGSCVASTRVKIQALERVTTTLFVRLHKVRRTGRKMGTSGSNPDPSPDANTLTSSMAAPDSRVRSEFMAFVRGREMDCMIGMRSMASSKAPLRHTAVKELMP
jgi:hypothetical protein